MKFDELFDTLIEACYKHSSGKKSGRTNEAHCGTHEEDAEETDENVAKKAKPYDKVTKADFLPKKVRDKINKKQ